MERFRCALRYGTVAAVVGAASIASAFPVWATDGKSEAKRA